MIKGDCYHQQIPGVYRDREYTGETFLLLDTYAAAAGGFKKSRFFSDSTNVKIFS